MGHQRFAAAFLLALATAAQIPPALAAPPDATEKSDDDKAQAKAHFEKGVALLHESAWSAALAEFLQSRALYPTRNATHNAALCLRKLERYDEALDMFETLLRQFPDLPADDKVAAQKQIVELRALVGTIEVQGAEPGAAIVIDGRYRGDYPSLEPLRVPAGSHVVRVYKEGFEPFESRVEVAGSQTAEVAARLRTLAQSGRLRVAEASGKTLNVIVDGLAVGTTPWQGLLTIGQHVVLLRGEGNLGTQPVTAPVRLEQTTPLTLRAEELASSLRVEPTPAGASVTIDAVVVGRGIWEGRLRQGAHTIEVAAEGFVPESRQIRLDKDERQILNITLNRDPRATLWQRPSRFIAEASGAFVLSPIYGGDIARNCADACSAGLGLGGYGVFRGGYELGSGIGFGIGLGYLALQRSITERSLAIQPVGLPEQRGTVSDTLAFSGLVANAWAAYTLGERVPLTLRLSGGFVFGSIVDERTGTFSASDGSTYSLGPIGDAFLTNFAYVDPEIRLGLRLGAHFSLSVGVETLLLFPLSKPSWNSARPINAGADGIGTFAEETFIDPLTVILAPGLGARYDF